MIGSSDGSCWKLTLLAFDEKQVELFPCSLHHVLADTQKKPASTSSHSSIDGGLLTSAAVSHKAKVPLVFLGFPKVPRFLPKSRRFFCIRLSSAVSEQWNFD